MTDIFISYAREDEGVANRIAEALMHEGWSVSWDRTIPAGKTWRQVIGVALDESSCIIVLWSTHSLTSHWVIEEADVGRERGVLCPVLIEKVVQPLGFRSIQTADLSDWKSDASAPSFRQLVDAMAQLIGREPLSSGTAPSSDVEGDRSPRSEDVVHGGHTSAPQLVPQLRVMRSRLGHLSFHFFVSSLIAVSWALAFISLDFNGPCKVGWAVTGALGGTLTGEILRRSLRSLGWPVVPLLGVAYASGIFLYGNTVCWENDSFKGFDQLGRVITGNIGWNHELLWMGVVFWALAGALAMVVIWANYRLDGVRVGGALIWNAILLTAVAWGAAWFLVYFIAPYLGSETTSRMMTHSSAGLIVGALGGSVTYVVGRWIAQRASRSWQGL